MSKYTKTLETVTAHAPSNVTIEQPKSHAIALEVGGPAMIHNSFGQKIVEQMLKKHMGISVQREAKKPRDVLEAALVKNTRGEVCMPPAAFKKAMLTGAMQVKGLKKTQLRTALFIVGASVPLSYDSITPRMDMVRTAGIGRTPDVRFRPQLNNWKARMVIRYSDTLSPATIVDLVQRAGNVGVGEWRPEKDGTFGTFDVLRVIEVAAEIKEVEELCSAPLRGLVIPQWALDADVDLDMLRKVMGEQASGGADASDASEGDEEAAE